MRALQEKLEAVLEEIELEPTRYLVTSIDDLEKSLQEYYAQFAKVYYPNDCHQGALILKNETIFVAVNNHIPWHLVEATELLQTAITSANEVSSYLDFEYWYEESGKEMEHALESDKNAMFSYFNYCYNTHEKLERALGKETLETLYDALNS